MRHARSCQPSTCFQFSYCYQKHAVRLSFTFYLGRRCQSNFLTVQSSFYESRQHFFLQLKNYKIYTEIHIPLRLSHLILVTLNRHSASRTLMLLMIEAKRLAYLYLLQQLYFVNYRLQSGSVSFEFQMLCSYPFIFKTLLSTLYSVWLKGPSGLRRCNQY